MGSLIIIINRFVSGLTGGFSQPTYPPADPANLRLVGVTQQHLAQVQIEWAWDAVTDPGVGASSVTYQTQHRAVGAASWGNVHDNRTSTTRQIAVTEDANTQYELRVRAINNLGATSAWIVSAPVSATTGQQPVEGRTMNWAGRTQAWAGRTQIWGT